MGFAEPALWLKTSASQCTRKTTPQSARLPTERNRSLPMSESKLAAKVRANHRSLCGSPAISARRWLIGGRRFVPHRHLSFVGPALRDGHCDVCRTEANVSESRGYENTGPPQKITASPRRELKPVRDSFVWRRREANSRRAVATRMQVTLKNSQPLRDGHCDVCRTEANVSKESKRGHPESGGSGSSRFPEP